MAIVSVEAEFQSNTITMTYNEITGYYECELTAPDLPSAFTQDKFYPITITATSERVVEDDLITSSGAAIVDNQGNHIQFHNPEPEGEDGTYVFSYEDYEQLRLKVTPNFITDRTQEDVDLVKSLNKKWEDGSITNAEKTVWNSNLKGALNRSDLERNEYNLYCLSELLDLGLTTCYNPNTGTYNIDEIPRTTYYTQLLNNVKVVYNSNRRYPTTPRPPEHPLSSYQKWNDIEQILHDVYYVGVEEV